jgi:hypothetical protein
LFLLDMAVALVVALLLTEILVRLLRLHQSWRTRRILWLLLFLVAWSAGIWLAPGPVDQVGWIAYSLPFVLAGLVAAVLIAVTSPLHRLTTPADRREFEREEAAVGVGVIAFFWSLCALLVAVAVWGYGAR